MDSAKCTALEPGHSPFGDRENGNDSGNEEIVGVLGHQFGVLMDREREVRG